MVQRQKDLNYSQFVASQMHYSILNREVEREFIPMSLYHGLGMMVWSPLSSGFLTGKYTRKNPHPEEGRLNTFDLGLFDRDLGYTVIDKIIDLAQKYQSTPTAVSIAWLLSKKVVSSVIIGISKEEQLNDNLAASDLKLSSEDIATIDELTKRAIKYPETFLAMHDSVLMASKRFGI